MTDHEAEMRRLDEIGFQHGTDKSRLGHDYLNIYEQLFAPLRDQPITLLELGVYLGYSLRTWREYFTAATIIGIDHQPLMTDTLPQTFVYQCDQTDPGLPEILAPHGPLDIVIDDCSHRCANTIASFKLLWPLLKGGGLYIIEDLDAHENLDALHFITGLTEPEMIEHPEYARVAWMRLSAPLAIIAKGTA